MVHRRQLTTMVVVVAALSMVAAACGKSDKSKSSTSTTVAVRQGGDLTFSAEQEPDTMDWIDANAGAAWGTYTVQTNTMPRAFFFNDKNEYEPSVTLAGEPKLDPGPPMKVTYKISPKAVWDDNQPITAHDFHYTWDQIAHGKDIYDTTGYSNISAVDEPDPKTAVVTFSTVYAGWRDLFGGNYGIFPSHLLEGKDRDALMKDGYTFSGGPWKLDHWTKQQEIKLVPNTNYFGKKPNLASITFKFLTDTSAEQQAYKSGQVSMVYPQAQPGQEALKGLPDTSFDAISGLSYEALWFNTAKFPVDSLKVRQAIAYGIDRDAIVKQLFSPVQPDIKRIDSFFTPAFRDAYTTPFAKYSPRDLTKVTDLMTSDGWTKGADGLWAKGGKKADLEIKTTTGNKRRQLTVEIVQSQLKEAGFNVAFTPEKAGVLFGQDGPKGNFQIALYAQTPSSNDVGECSLWCSVNIPGPANNNSGTNWYRIKDTALDDAWTKADAELDVTKRTDLAKQGQQALADTIPGLPVDPFPDIIVYNTRLIGGPVRHNFATGPFVYANEWFLKG